ncbi:MAG: hypothetical protein PHH11_02440 [Methylomonas sp.]|nr:hypothetical protein [Methylomonas sp.]
MEPLAPAKRLILIAAATTLTATAGYLTYRHIASLSFSQLVSNDLPFLDLTVKLVDGDGDALESTGSLIAGDDEAPPGDEHCPALSGGDIDSPSVASTDTPRPKDCPHTATWYVKKHPIAFTLTFNDGEVFLDWWDRQPQIKNLVDNRFTQGLFFGLLKSLKIKAEQLKLEGLQGEFLAQVVRDAILADAELHYDMAHGNRGWVLNYQRSNSAFADQAIPAMAGLLASSGYRIAKLKDPLLEMRIGGQQFFLTEHQGCIYLAQSLEALLNVIDNTLTEQTTSDSPLSLTFRAEAFLDNILPVLTGSSSWQARWDFDLKGAKPGTLTLPGGPWSQQLHASLFEGTLAAIPHDAFAAVATSLKLPPEMTLTDWQRLASSGPLQTAKTEGAGGFALVWDFDAESPGGAVGIVIANPAEPQASPAYNQYLKNQELSAECAGGGVFLAASSQSLLNRMRESCERQSLSPLDWQRGSEKQRYLNSQLIAFANPGTGIRQLFLAGGAGNEQDVGEFAPRWKQDYEQAKAAMRKEGDKLFSGLPIFSYAGRIGGDGSLTLQGQWVAQEIEQ